MIKLDFGVVLENFQTLVILSVGETFVNAQFLELGQGQFKCG